MRCSEAQEARLAHSPGARLADLRQLEQGDCRKWYPARDQILATLPLLTETVKMSLWESVPLDEIEPVLDEIEELHDRQRGRPRRRARAAGPREDKAKIEKMQRTRRPHRRRDRGLRAKGRDAEDRMLTSVT